MKTNKELIEKAHGIITNRPREEFLEQCHYVMKTVRSTDFTNEQREEAIMGLFEARLRCRDNLSKQDIDFFNAVLEDWNRRMVYLKLFPKIKDNIETKGE